MTEIKVTKEDGTKITISEVDLARGVEVTLIPNDESWKLDLSQVNGESFSYDHVGGRPNDRK